MNLTTKQIVLICLGAYLLVVSILTFAAYGIDKAKAKKGSWRTKEATLLLLSFFGGAFGGYPAMLIFHHKTKGEHWYFTLTNILGILLWGGAILIIAFGTAIPK